MVITQCDACFRTISIASRKRFSHSNGVNTMGKLIGNVLQWGAEWIGNAIASYRS